MAQELAPKISLEYSKEYFVHQNTYRASQGNYIEGANGHLKIQVMVCVCVCVCLVSKSTS